jgi:hypothetical protein
MTVYCGGRLHHLQMHATPILGFSAAVGNSLDPFKCQALHISSKRAPSRILYTIHGHQMEKVEAIWGSRSIKNSTGTSYPDKCARKQIPPEHFRSETIPSAQLRPRHCATLHLYDLSWNAMSSSGIPTKPITLANWRWHREDQWNLSWATKTTNSVSAMMNELHWQTLQERRAQSK